MAIPTSSYSPYGATAGTGGGVDDFIKKYQLTQQVQQQQPQPSPISELDEFLAGLPSDKRNAVEVSPEYQNRKLRLFDRFLTYSIAMTTDGNSFLNTKPGRKLAQDLLDSAQNVAMNFESESRNELAQMKDLIAKQSNQIEKLQSELNEQKLIYDFSKSEKKREEQRSTEDRPKPPAIIVSSRNGGND